MEELLPSEVRTRILQEHRVLHTWMSRVRGMSSGSDGAVSRIVPELLAVLTSVIDLESELLIPTLRSIDAWGEERTRRLVAWHLDIRERTAELRRDLATQPDAVLAGRVRGFVARLAEELEQEERLHLSKELLAELPIPTDLGGA